MCVTDTHPLDEISDVKYILECMFNRMSFKNVLLVFNHN